MLLATTAAFAQGLPTNSDFELDGERPEIEFFDIETDTDAQTHSVVNGSLTSDYSQVGVLAAVFSDGSAAPFCSGSLITSDVVLTAAHCIEGFSDFAEEPELQGFVFAMGADMFSGLDDYRWISAAEIHPDYNPHTIAWDLGLLQLDEPVTAIKPLCINDEDISSDWYGVSVDYVGWGMTSMEDPMDGYKRTVAIPMVGHNSTHFFTYVENKNICHGDSGGGAIVELTDGTRMLTGVNSYGLDVETGEYYGCDVEGAGAAAARVDIALDWILPYTGDITCDSSDPIECPDGTSWNGEECVKEGTTPTTPTGSSNGDSDGGSLSDGGGVKVGCACSSAGNNGVGGGIALALLSLLGLVRRRQS